MSFVKVLNITDDKNVYFIGDIHGNYKLYSRFLEELGITKDDIIISVGDIIDRGKQNVKMLFEFLCTENRYMVLGNHEKMMMDSFFDITSKICWLQNGGQETLDEIGESGIKHFSTLLENVPYLIEVNHMGKKIGVCHSAIPNYIDINDWDIIKDYTKNNDQYRHNLIWDRTAIDAARFEYTLNEHQKLQKYITGVDYVIHGHTGVPHKFQYGNRIWIDTQFMSGNFTLAQYNPETQRMKYYTMISDVWGDNYQYTIKEYE